MILLQGLTNEELLIQIRTLIREELKQIQNQSAPVQDEYITRSQAAERLHVSLPTLHEWSKQGRIMAYKIGNRILYKKSEITSSVRKVNYR